MPISSKVSSSMSNASYIRKMFEEGNRLRKEMGPDRVFDFSLGNPILEPPSKFQEKLKQLVNQPVPGMHRYMPNAGYPEARAKIASYVSTEHGVKIEQDDVIMTCGAGAGLNIALKSLLDPGDEVIVLAPFFPEYSFYIDNHGGQIKIVQTNSDFVLDPSAIEAAITNRTKALILNSPNNPTGCLYSASSLQNLGEILKRAQNRFDHPITLLSDEPYRKIVFDGEKTPTVLAVHPNTILITSHSKDLGLAGERIGYAVISPEHSDRVALRGALTFTNRTLGFVNAPALFQRCVADVQDASVDISTYQKLRDLLCAGLKNAGFQFTLPQGAFYVFPKTPIPDDVAFVQHLLKYGILSVPGSGFGRSGHIRLCFSVTQQEIERSLPLFAQSMKTLS
jgi:aspartate aminotransferase